MYLTNKVKEEIFKENGSSEKDSGSAEGQVALFTTRINHLTKHLKNNKKDYLTSNIIQTKNDPVFIVGFPRSGTTLIEQILDSHPNLDVLDEKPIVEETINYFKQNIGTYPGSIHKIDVDNIDQIREHFYSTISQHMEIKKILLLFFFMEEDKLDLLGKR